MIMFQSPLIAIVLTLLMGLGFGVLSGTLVNIGIPPFLATLGTMWIAQGLAEYLGVKPTPVPSHFSSFNIISFETPPVTAIILILISVISLEILATKVPIGRYIYYVGGNEYGTYISGVDVKLIKYIIYSFSGFSASIGGILLTSWTTSGYKWVALGQEFTAIAASVIGGASLAGGEGRVFKTIIAMVLLITISSLYTFLGLPPTLFFLTEGFLILGAALFQIKFRRG
jgi:ribose/xylose/arabinose/galactoside ABC-type transport system permease subunit